MKISIKLYFIPLVLLLGCLENAPNATEGFTKINGDYLGAERAFPNLLGVLDSFKIEGKTAYYNKISNLNIFEGDILLTDTQTRNFNSAYGRTGSAPANNNILLRWTNSRVPYVIVNTSRTSDILEALAMIEANSNVDFVVRTSETNYVSFIDGDGCSSYVGMIGGNQNITIGSLCPIGSIVHEICHALGIWHEQSRPDRDNSIVINYQNIQQGASSNFDKVPTALNYGQFDLSSIMMYGSFAFSTGGPTITRLDGSTFSANRDNLTLTDIQSITDLYPPRVLNLDGIDVGANSSGVIYYIKQTLNQPKRVYSSSGLNIGGTNPTRLCVHPNGNPYIISNNNVHYYSNGQWINIGKPGGSSPMVNTIDIAAGEDGSIYAVSNTSSGVGTTSKLFKYSGSWSEISGCPKSDRISVQGDGSVWLISLSLGTINRYSNGSWATVIKPNVGTITDLFDIGASGNSVYLISKPRNLGNRVYRYSQNLQERWIEQRIDSSIDSSIASGLNGEIII